jgi:hypothetical protein
MPTPLKISHWIAPTRRSDPPALANQRLKALFSCGSMVPPACY